MAVEIRFDPPRISVAELLEASWMNIDPAVGGDRFVARDWDEDRSRG